MNILVISHEFPPLGGGGANACYFLTKGFAENGHEVTLVTARYKELPEREKINGVEIIRVTCKRENKEQCSFKEMLSYLIHALMMADKLQRERNYDICMVFFGIPSGPIGYVLKKKYRLPYVIRFGGGDVPGFQERFTKLYKLLAPAIKIIWKNADARIVNSLGLKKLAINFYDKVDFEIICNGVDTDLFTPPINKTNDGKFRILFVSRLIERKGLQYVIPQFKKVIDFVEDAKSDTKYEIEKKAGHYKEIELIVVGDGPYRKELERITAENELTQYIKFEGQKDKADLISYYQKADLFILPSKKEGMPNVVLEAMACGLPILMTPCQGSEELVVDNGYIEPADMFACRIIDIITDQNLLERLSENSRCQAEKVFSWDNVNSAYEEVLEQRIRNESINI